MKNTLKLTLTLGALVLALVLASCQSLLDPPAAPGTSAEESTVKAEVTVEPAETNQPADTAEPDETAAPADTDELGETASPTETAEPETTEPETTEPELSIPKQPLSALVANGKAVFKGHDPNTQVYSNTMGDYRVHLGIDVATDLNAEVYALYDGTVTNIWEDNLMGHCLALDHGNGLVSIYKNLSGSYPANVAEGATVQAGQAVGYVGESALMEMADEPHLHFEMALNDLSVNPADYLEGIQAPTPDEPETDKPTPENPEINFPRKPLSALVANGKAIFKGHDPNTQVYSNTMGDYRIHLGIDVATDMNAEVYALYDGTVEKIWADAMMGHCLAINHGNGLMSFYKNLSGSYPAGVEVGATVTAGQAVGYVGDSAMIEIADEPHLHFEMTLDGLTVNPANYLEGIQASTPDEPETNGPENDNPELNLPKQPLSALVANGTTVFKKHDPNTQVYSNTMGDYRVHLGIDVTADLNAEVYTLYDGTVENIWEDIMEGYCLAINHGNGFISIYKNLSGSYPAGVEVGATVTAGQAVGYVGDSAMIEIADEPHLHFEMTLNGDTVNPLDYLNE